MNIFFVGRWSMVSTCLYKRSTMPFGSGRWYRPVKEEAFRVSGSDPDARDKGDARKMHRGQLPISHPFEVEEFHCFACTEFIGSVVTDLDDVTGFISTEEDRLRLGEVVEEEIRISLFGESSVHLVVGKFLDDGLFFGARESRTLPKSAAGILAI